MVCSFQEASSQACRGLAQNPLSLQASKRAILNANYMAARLEGNYKVLFKGKNGTCAHEFIIDLRKLEESADITPRM